MSPALDVVAVCEEEGLGPGVGAQDPEGNAAGFASDCFVPGRAQEQMADASSLVVRGDGKAVDLGRARLMRRWALAGAYVAQDVLVLVCDAGRSLVLSGRRKRGCRGARAAWGTPRTTRRRGRSVPVQARRLQRWCVWSRSAGCAQELVILHPVVLHHPREGTEPTLISRHNRTWAGISPPVPVIALGRAHAGQAGQPEGCPAWPACGQIGRTSSAWGPFCPRPAV